MQTQQQEQQKNNQQIGGGPTVILKMNDNVVQQLSTVGGYRDLICKSTFFLTKK